MKRLRSRWRTIFADRSVDEAPSRHRAHGRQCAILDEHQATAEGDKSAADAAVRLALKLAPDNSYVDFLDRKLRE